MNQNEFVGKPFRFHNLSISSNEWKTEEAQASLSLMQRFRITISTKLIKITCQWIHQNIRGMPQTANVIGEKTKIETIFALDINHLHVDRIDKPNSSNENGRMIFSAWSEIELSNQRKK